MASRDTGANGDRLRTVAGHSSALAGLVRQRATMEVAVLRGACRCVQSRLPAGVLPTCRRPIRARRQIREWTIPGIKRGIA
jgi:hypothetical protein